MPGDPEPQLRQRHGRPVILDCSAVELELPPHDTECHINERAHQDVWAHGPLVSHPELRPDGGRRDDVRAVVGAMRDEPDPELQVEWSAIARVPVRRGTERRERLMHGVRARLDRRPPRGYLGADQHLAAHAAAEAKRTGQPAAVVPLADLARDTRPAAPQGGPEPEAISRLALLLAARSRPSVSAASVPSSTTRRVIRVAHS